MKNLKKLFVRGGSAVAVGAALVVSQSASAAGWDCSSLTSDVDFSTIGNGRLAPNRAALLATVYRHRDRSHGPGLPAELIGAVRWGGFGRPARFLAGSLIDGGFI
ncbi:hypothetical protein [Pseudomonas aeruginosa]|uniref:hypothetical protein n=1 Tax=Pseudomonas aeruginosa TaxID=287 RepID=UPI0021B34CCC|nr:hypothetical protein [Pseudomonas aeruginosa]MCT7418585.1 hypothetical protein [Pseudomonas aeruginosa]